MIVAPILIICFDRPEKAAQVIEQIKHHESELYLFRDGGGNPEHEQAFKELFEKTAEERVGKTIIRMEPENLGGRDGPATAIQWFFSQVPSGIVLEEDILPDIRMIYTYSVALEEFKNDHSIFALGSAPNKNVRPAGPEAWTRSPLFFVWGWASWANRIQHCKIPNYCWRRQGGGLLQRIQSLAARLYLNREFTELAKNPHMCWSYYLQLHALAEEMDVLIPETKLTHNTGIGLDARRTKYCSDDKPDSHACFCMAEKEPRANANNPRWQRAIEAAKFNGLIHEIRNRLQLRTRIKKLRNSFQ